MRYQNGPGPLGRVDQVVIVGGGVGGMAAALGLARAGRRVMVLERDDLSVVRDVEEAFVRPRRGAPQARQTHGLLARLTRVLRERYPDVLAALFAAGATEVPLTGELGAPAPGDEELAILLVRRTTLEWVLRQAVLREPGVTFRSDAAVAGLVTDAEGPGAPRVLGVRLGDGEVVPAGAVIASTGRRSEVVRWLGDAGVEVPEEVHDTNLTYLTRWYRYPVGADPVLDPKMGGDLGFAKYLAVPGDNCTFSVTIAVPSSDAELRSRLMDTAAFDAAARRLPGAGSVFAQLPLVPIGPVEPMGGFVNRLRRFLDPDGRPLVLGFHVVGDAHTCTNPFYGRGCSLALMQATMLTDAFAAHPDDAGARSVAYERQSAREVEPWFHDTVQMDSVLGVGGAPTVADRDADRDGGEPGNGALRMFGKVMAASEHDPVIARGILRMVNMLSRPEDLATDLDFATRVAMVLADPDAPTPAPLAGPTRAEILAPAAA